MTHQFAKLFEFEDDQLLVRKHDDDTIVIETKFYRYKDFYLSTAVRDSKFSSFDQKASEEVYKSMTKQD